MRSMEDLVPVVYESLILRSGSFFSYKSCYFCTAACLDLLLKKAHRTCFSACDPSVWGEEPAQHVRTCGQCRKEPRFKCSLAVFFFGIHSWPRFALSTVLLLTAWILLCFAQRGKHARYAVFTSIWQAKDKKSLPHCEDRNLKEDGDPYNLVLP